MSPMPTTTATIPGSVSMPRTEATSGGFVSREVE